MTTQGERSAYVCHTPHLRGMSSCPMRQDFWTGGAANGAGRALNGWYAPFFEDPRGYRFTDIEVRRGSASPCLIAHLCTNSTSLSSPTTLPLKTVPSSDMRRRKAKAMLLSTEFALTRALWCTSTFELARHGSGTTVLAVCSLIYARPTQTSALRTQGRAASHIQPLAILVNAHLQRIVMQHKMLASTAQLAPRTSSRWRPAV